MGRLRVQLVGHERSVSDVAFSPDGRTLLSAANDGPHIHYGPSTTIAATVPSTNASSRELSMQGAA